MSKPSGLFRAALVLVALLASAVGFFSPAIAGPLHVGAARIDITPPLLPMLNGQPETLNDHLYVRAIVLDNGETRAALINADQVGLSDETWEQASKKIAQILNCPVGNILISAIHTHSDGGTFSRHFVYPDGPKPPKADFPSLPDSMTKAVSDAFAHMVPAKVGFATEPVYLNVNRDAISPTTHRWYQGPNPDGPSDKTLAVLTFETLDGKPIGIYLNYAMHPVSYFLTGVVSADFPGAAALVLEQAYPESVAVFTQGASGDQNPRFLGPTEKVRAILSSGSGDKAASQTPKSASQQNADRVVMGAWEPSQEGAVKKAVADLTSWVDAEGQLLARATMRAIETTDNFRSDIAIDGGQTILTCPGRTRTDHGREGVEGSYELGPDIPIRTGLLRIGSVAIGAVDAELYTQIGLRLKSESPVSDTMLVTLTNGRSPSGYIYDDASYTHQTFQVLGSRLQPGCAETAIVDGILNLMRSSK